MKSQLIAIVAAVLVVGCATTQQPEPPTAKAPDISIHDAAVDRNIEAVKQHLAAGADVNAKGDGGLTPLHFATVGNHKGIVELFIAKGADVNAKEVNGNTPLLIAIGDGHKEIAELLIANGADVNAIDKYGFTPLHGAAFTGGTSVFKLLIENGANVNAKNLRGQTPLDLAESKEQKEIADLLRKHGGKTADWFNADKSIHTAARVGHIEAVKQHLAAGTDVNAKLDRGYTALQLAVHGGHKEIAQLLIAAGADVNAKDDDGDTPLDQAILDKQPETADLLRKHGGKTKKELEAVEPVAEAAKPEPPPAKVPVSLIIGIAEGNIKAVKQHLAAGTDVNAKDKDDKYGTTLLHRAAGGGQTEIVELLIAESADVNAKDNRGRTPLYRAATKEIAELLIAKGADVDGWSWEKAQSQRCVNNLKQIGIATRIYATDNQDRYPWQVPQSEGGTAEIAQPRSDTDALLDSDGKPIFDANAWQHFLALTNELSNPKVLRCPNDESRTQANTFQSTPPEGAGRHVIPFDKNSVSYWLRTDPEVDEARPDEVMVVCPHHDGQYNILFTDSSSLGTDWNRLARYFKDITKPITIAPQ